MDKQNCSSKSKGVLASRGLDPAYLKTALSLKMVLVFLGIRVVTKNKGFSVSFRKTNNTNQVVS
jgi:NAD(P)H-dependent FMN reductase